MSTDRVVLIRHNLTANPQAVRAAKQHINHSDRNDTKVSTIGLVHDDTSETQVLSQLQASPDAETLAKVDDPALRMQSNIAEALLLNRQQLNGTELGLGEHREGWNAQTFEVVSGGDEAIKVLEDAGAEVLHEYNNGEGSDTKLCDYKSVSEERINERAKEEGFGNVQGYVNVVAEIAGIKNSHRDGSSPLSPEQLAAFIKDLEGKLKREIHGDDARTPVYQAAILEHMIRLEKAREEAVNNLKIQEAAKIQDILDGLEKDDQIKLKLKLQDPFIFGRQSKDAELELGFLGVTVKKLGDQVEHRVEENPGTLNKPELDGNPVVETSRSQISKDIYQNRHEDLARAEGVGIRYSVLTGTYSQSLPEDAINYSDYVTSEGSQNITESEYCSLLETALIHEALGLENNDWSASHFIKNDGEVNLIKYRESKPFSPLHAADVRKRLDKVKNIAQSFHNIENRDQIGKIQERVGAMHDRLLGDRTTIEGLVRNVEQNLDSKHIKYDQNFADKVLMNLFPGSDQVV